MPPQLARGCGRAIALLAATTLVVACSDDDPGSTPPPAQSIGVSLAATTMTVVQGQSGTVQIAVARNNGFAGAVTLAVTAPSGITATLSPTSVPAGSSASALTLAAAATVAPGTFPVTVTASGTGVTNQTAALTLTVTAAPSVSIAVAPTSLSVVQGQSAATTLTLTRAGGFAGPVDVTVEGLPASVTAAAAPATIAAGATTSAITVTAAAAAAVGPSTLTVRVRGQGVADQTVLLPLAVTAAPQTPAFTLALAAGTLTVQQGASATVNVTLARTGGFTGPVTLALEGAPQGIGGTFAPNPATTDAATLTVSAAATVATGTYSATVRGTGQGVAERTTTLQITVSPAVSVGDYAISVSPATVSVQQGQTGSATVSLARTGGFAGAVTLTTSGAPAGLTVTGPTAPVTGDAATLSIAAASTLAPGTYQLTVRGAAAGLTDHTATVSVTVTAAPAAGYTIALDPPALTLAQGGSAASNLNITRTGGFNAAIGIAISGVPTGVTVTPATVSITGNAVSLAVSASATAAPGTYPITVTTTAPGIADRTATLTVTVTAAAGFSLALTPATFTLQQGQSTTLTVNLARTGGFAAAVALAATGLPNGVTATVSPTSVTGASATLTLQASATAATGAFTLTVRGTAAGLPDATATAAGTVTASGGQGSVPLAFCQDDPPLWVAYQTTPGGAWTRATIAANGTVSVPLAASGGAVAVVTRVGTGYDLTVVHAYGAANDLTRYGSQACQSAPGGKRVSGSVAGLAGPTDQATITLGSAMAGASGAEPTFTLDDVPPGPRDLIATRTRVSIGSGGITTATDRVILRRNLNPANGSTLPVLDFGAAEAFAPASANLTITNAGTDVAFPFVGYVTANGTSGFFYNGVFDALLGTPATVPRYYGIPADRQAAGDLHMVFAFAAPRSGDDIDDTNTRAAGTFFRVVADRSIALGPALQPPAVTIAATSPYVRPRVQLARQSEYGSGLMLDFTQEGAAPRSASLVVLPGAVGSGDWDVTFPDLSGVEGFDPTWGLRPGTAVDWMVSAVGGDALSFLAEQPAEGATFRMASRSGTRSAALRALVAPSALRAMRALSVLRR